jgi:hypothetical protein
MVDRKTPRRWGIEHRVDDARCPHTGYRGGIHKTDTKARQADAQDELVCANVSCVEEFLARTARAPTE